MPGTVHVSARTKRNTKLAIFFWIMPVVVSGASNCGTHEESLAIFFWIMHRPQNRSFTPILWQHLAIFFWIMPGKGMGGEAGRRPVWNLLFSFELCVEEWNSLLRSRHGRSTCYFLLNYAHQIVTVQYYLKTIVYSLLFSFELCSKRYMSSVSCSFTRTCYFLLNYACQTRSLPLCLVRRRTPRR